MTALRKVLVVDDDPVVGKSFDRVLSGKGYAVITAKDGEEALRKIASEDYDVVYTDIKMPGISGLEVAERVKANRPWTPVVIVTGYGTEEAERRAKAAGVVGFLHKPLSPEMIEGSATDALATAAAPVAPVAEPEAAAKGGTLRNIALFFAGPFIGLAYLVALPFVGLGVLAWLAARALRANATARRIGVMAKHVGMAIAAPFIGLAYICVFPFIGLAMVAWLAVRAAIGGGRE